MGCIPVLNWVTTLVNIKFDLLKKICYNKICRKQNTKLQLELEVAKMKKNIAIIVLEITSIIVLCFFDGLEFQLTAGFIGICLGISVYHFITFHSLANRKYRIFKKFYKEFSFAKKNANGFNEPVEDSAKVLLRAEKEISKYGSFLSKKKKEEITNNANEAREVVQ